MSVALHLTQHKGLMPYGTHPNIRLKTSFMLDPIAEIDLYKKQG